AYIRDNPHKPFVIFLDINMPVMNGWQFLEVISTDAKHNDMKINILTSSIDPSDIRKTQEIKQVFSFLTKPLKRDELKTIKSKL
ncbi:MAG TPA: response regulator, partial [Aquaticitalea sp.]|nr:response regulator [Aquaticitalea sp.]